MLNALSNLSFRGIVEWGGGTGSERKYKAAPAVDVVGGR